MAIHVDRSDRPALTFPTLIALTVIATFVVFIVALQMRRYSAAKLTLETPRGKIQPGDAVTATLHIKAKRDLVWDRAVIALKCIDTQDRDDDHPVVEVYRDEIEVAGPDTLTAGQSTTLTAQFTAPRSVAKDGVDLTLPDSIQAIMEPMKDAALRRRAQDISWRIEARVDTPLVLTTDRLLDFDLLP